MPKIKLVSWNVNSLRAITKKDFLPTLTKSDWDIVCLQETKLSDVTKLEEKLIHPADYQSYWSFCQERKGYSGVAIYSKVIPLEVKTDFGDNILSKEGRLIQLTFPDFILINGYFPNGGSGAVRLKYKLEFYKQFLVYLKKLLKEKKNVIFCGDVNTAHQEIDLARPKANSQVSGFLPEERVWLDKFIEAGFVDIFRHLNKEGSNYTWWDYKSKARDRNVGWRIDYFFVIKKLVPKVKDAFILDKVMGSDHCPTGIVLNI